METEIEHGEWGYEASACEKRESPYASHGCVMFVGSRMEFMAPTGKSGFRKKNAAETRMIARPAFNHARASGSANFSSQSGLVADTSRSNYRTVPAM